METITKKSFVIITISLLVGFTSLNAAAYPCEKFLLQRIERIKKSWVPPRLLAPREKPSWPQRWRGEPPSGKKLSKWVTVPANLAAMTALFVYADQWAANREIEKFQSALEQNIYGSDTIAEWLLTGGLAPDDAREVYSHTLDRFHNHLQPMQERVDDFARLKWWSSESVQLAHQILDRVGKEPDAVVVRSDLIQKIQNDPDYPALEKQIGDNGFTLDLWLMPRVNYLGKSDVDWLAILFDPAQDAQWTPQQRTGLEAIRQIYDYDGSRVSFVVLTELTAKTLKNGGTIEAKLEKAKKLGLPVDKPTFSRADLPIAPETFKDGNKWYTFNDELDRWNLMLKDPRFKTEAEAWRQGQLADVAALTEFGKHWHLLEQRK